MNKYLQNQQAPGMLQDAVKAQTSVQAAFVMAKENPRDEDKCREKIEKACKRVKLAEQAMYEFPKGGTKVRGESIRLMEVLAQYWGNMDCGVREVSQTKGMSICEAYAVDLENNTRIAKEFHVPHKRFKKGGKFTELVDARDIYEVVANQGARRLRTCISALIPRDIIDEAVEHCENTLRQSIGDIGEQVDKIEKAFAEYGVTMDDITQEFGCTRNALSADDVVRLKGIFLSLRDNMVHPSKFFSTIAPPKVETRNQTDDNALDELEEILNS